MNLTTDQAFDIIFLHTGIARELLTSKSRKGEIVKARHLFVYLCRKYIKVKHWGKRNEMTPITYRAIGLEIKNHHSSVLQGLRTFKNHLSYDKGLQKEIEALEGKINNNVT